MTFRFAEMRWTIKYVAATPKSRWATMLMNKNLLAKSFAQKPGRFTAGVRLGVDSCVAGEVFAGAGAGLPEVEGFVGAAAVLAALVFSVACFGGAGAGGCFAADGADAAGAGGSSGAGFPGTGEGFVAGAALRSFAISASNRLRCPSEVTPHSLRSSFVSSASVSTVT